MATTVAEPSVISVILEPVTLVLSFIVRGLTSIPYALWASRLASLIAYPLRLLLIPFRIATSLLLTVLSPLLLVLSYAATIAGAIWRLLASLEALYTFFGAAAFVGILAGILLSLTSEYMSTRLGINSTTYAYEDDDGEDVDVYPAKGRRLQKQQQHGRYIQEMYDDDGVGDDDEHHRYGNYASANSTASDLEKPWLDISSPSPTRRRLASTGLLSQTIHEEDDDE